MISIAHLGITQATQSASQATRFDCEGRCLILRLCESCGQQLHNVYHGNDGMILQNIQCRQSFTKLRIGKGRVSLVRYTHVAMEAIEDYDVVAITYI